MYVLTDEIADVNVTVMLKSVVMIAQYRGKNCACVSITRWASSAICANPFIIIGPGQWLRPKMLMNARVSKSPIDS